MTEDEIQAIIRHPLVRRTIRSIANAEARSMVENYLGKPGARVHWIDYRAAAFISGMTYQTIRLYVSKGKLIGGSGKVTMASLQELMDEQANYKQRGRPRHK